MPEFKTKEEYEKWKAEKIKAAQLLKEAAPAAEATTTVPIAAVPTTRKYGIKEYVGFAAVGIIFIGVFLPFVRVPIFGNINYFRNGQGDGAILLIFVLGTLLFIFINKMKWLWATGAGSAATLLFTFYNLYEKMSEISAHQEEIKQSLAGNPFAGMAAPILDAVQQSIQLDFGVPVLIIGTLLIFVSAFLNIRKA